MPQSLSPFSNRDFTGHSFVDIPDDSIVENSCFSQETPDKHIFRENMNKVIFRDCNLDNVFIPKGNIISNCSQKKFAVQNDKEDWIVDETNSPVVPIAQKQYETLGLSIDPNDIPPVKMEQSIITVTMEEIQGGKPLPDDKFTPPA